MKHSKECIMKIRIFAISATLSVALGACWPQPAPVQPQAHVNVCMDRVCLIVSPKGFVVSYDMNENAVKGKTELPGFGGAATVTCNADKYCLITDGKGQIWRANIAPTILQPDNKPHNVIQ
jgi:hypothetical protein